MTDAAGRGWCAEDTARLKDLWGATVEGGSEWDEWARVTHREFGRVLAALAELDALRDRIEALKVPGRYIFHAVTWDSAIDAALAMLPTPPREGA